MLGDGFLSENARGGETPRWVRVGSWNWEDETAGDWNTPRRA